MFVRPVVLFAALATLLGTPTLKASGRKDDKARMSIHFETEATDNPKMILPKEIGGKTRFFSRTSEISMKDIKAFKPFVPEDGGGDTGVILMLKPGAVERLSGMTHMNQGRYWIVQLNGRIVDSAIIDKPVEDGVVVVWKGVTAADIESLDKTIPRVGQAKKAK